MDAEAARYLITVLDTERRKSLAYFYLSRFDKLTDFTETEEKNDEHVLFRSPLAYPLYMFTLSV